MWMKITSHFVFTIFSASHHVYTIGITLTATYVSPNLLQTTLSLEMLEIPWEYFGLSKATHYN